MLHSLFDDRQEYDYKEFVEFSSDDAKNAVQNAEEFIDVIKEYIAESPD